MSFKPDERLLMKMLDIFLSETEPLKYIKQFLPNMSLQFLNREELANFKKNGGNCLGVDDNDWPLIGMPL